MIIKKWNDLPSFLKTKEVKPYYDILRKKQFSLILKRIFDIIASIIMIIVLLPLFTIISIAIKVDSKGSIFFKQKRIAQYGRTFKILKFRTMIENAEMYGNLVTVDNDNRITKTGRFLRKYRLDELPQLFNVLMGDMSFVGIRPEVEKYVDAYTNEMNATLIFPAGITSLASIKYKDEAALLNLSKDIDDTYIMDILPDKMKYNLKEIKEFSLFNDIKIMFMTLYAVMH